MRLRCRLRGLIFEVARAPKAAAAPRPLAGSCAFQKNEVEAQHDQVFKMMATWIASLDLNDLTRRLLNLIEVRRCDVSCFEMLKSVIIDRQVHPTTNVGQSALSPRLQPAPATNQTSHDMPYHTSSNNNLKLYTTAALHLLNPP